MLVPLARAGYRAVATVAIAVATALAPVDATRAHDPDGEEIALGSLVDAELAFARLALEQGIRAAFLASFAPDGVVFEPAPVRLHEAWPTRRAPADPKALRLDWSPSQAGVSRDRLLGYTTGAFTLTDAARPDGVRRGVYFSVWKRDSPGATWRVVLDAGVVTPQAADFAALGAAPRPRFAGRTDAVAQRRALLAREARTFEARPANARTASYADLLAPDVRLHRDGMAPLAGRAAVARHFAGRAAAVVWTPIDAVVAASGDFACTYGRYRETSRGAQAQAGYYVHLWLRDDDGRWRLAYDIATVAPG